MIGAVGLLITGGVVSAVQTSQPLGARPSERTCLPSHFALLVVTVRPCPQPRQLVLPAWGWYLPAAHAVHELCLLLGCTLPGTQSWHVLALAAEYLPGVHAAQLVLLADEDVPAGQPLQTVAAGWSWKVPAGQTAQVREETKRRRPETKEVTVC